MELNLTSDSDPSRVTLKVQMKYDDRPGVASEFDGNDLLDDIAAQVRSELSAHGIDITYLEMALSPLEADSPRTSYCQIDDLDDLADDEEEAIQRAPVPLTDGKMDFAIRARIDPQTLNEATDMALEEIIAVRYGLMFKVEPV